MKGAIHWVSVDTAVPCSVRCYGYLLKPDLGEADAAAADAEADADAADEADAGDFMSQLNPHSKTVHAAFAEPALRGVQPMERFQFERSGYFVVDKDSRPDAIVFNRTLALKESGLKKSENVLSQARSRKTEQQEAIAAKEAAKKLDPREMFRSQPDLYSQFDADGLPTHDAQGVELSKSKVKALKKDWDKQKKLFDVAHK